MMVQQGSAQSAAAPCPPPGLESQTAPAKVEVGETLKLHASGGPSIEPAGGCYTPELATQGEWVNAVMTTAPYLDAQGLQQALSILDCAIYNVQEVKALDSAISDVYEAAGGMADSNALAMSMPQLMTAELARNHIFEQQQMLLHQLHYLRASAQAYDLAADSAGPAADPMADLSNQQFDIGMQGDILDQGSTAKADGSGDAAIAERVLDALGHVQKTDKGNGRAGKAARPAGAAAGPAAGAAAATAGATAPPKSHLSKQGDCMLRGPARQQVQTLSTSLQLLASEDPDCLFIVRRINKLGFKACRKLKQHFSAYGAVVRVLVAHSTVRQHGDPQCNSRRRPSSLGFVHMASAEAVRKVLAEGDEQEVDGAFIRVQRFERQASDGALEEEAADDGQHGLLEREAFAKDDWCRQQSAFSTASTRTAASTATSSDFDLAGADAASAEQESS